MTFAYIMWLQNLQIMSKVANNGHPLCKIQVRHPYTKLYGTSYNNQMGQNNQDGKYALFVSLFVSFHRDLESKWAIVELRKKFPVDKYTEESNMIA